MGSPQRTSLRRQSAVGALLCAYACTPFLTPASFAEPVTSTQAIISTDDAARPVEIKPGSNAFVTYNDALDSYENGEITQALIQAKSAGSNGSADAQVMVGYIMRTGEIGLKDLNDAARWYKMAAAQNHPDALVALGEMSLRGQAGLSPDMALDYLTRAANQDRPDAMRVLADMYNRGTGVEVDTDKAAEWLSRASNNGDLRSARRMGDLHIDKDPKQALRWYEKAAAQGDVEAAYIAAVMYAENFDIKPDAKKAAKFMAQAAKGGIAAAQADYGLLVYQGAGVPRNVEKAADWFEKSAKGGDKEGQFLYAFTLAKGEGVTQSFEDAYYWLLKSGDSGVDEYDQDRTTLKQRLEDNVDADALASARKRFEREN